jgi:hypothetical protein
LKVQVEIRLAKTSDIAKSYRLEIKAHEGKKSPQVGKSIGQMQDFDGG